VRVGLRFEMRAAGFAARLARTLIEVSRSIATGATAGVSLLLGCEIGPGKP